MGLRLGLIIALGTLAPEQRRGTLAPDGVFSSIYRKTPTSLQSRGCQKKDCRIIHFITLSLYYSFTFYLSTE
jgi:hypothetical protein